MTNNELTELIKNDNFYYIPGYESLYLMDKLGRVLSMRNRKLIKHVKYNTNTLVYSLYKNKKVERHSIFNWYSKVFGTIAYRRVNLNGELVW